MSSFEPSSPIGSPSQTLAAMSSPMHSPTSGAGASSPQNQQQQQQQPNPLGGNRANAAVNQLQWTNLTKFSYQPYIGRVAEQLGLSRRFAHLQDRVIFFRPAVRRRCPNGIMTERVVFVTPNGMLHLCDNDAAPKRTLALTELLSVVTDSVSQIALITDWPLVLRFDAPRNASRETLALPGLKLLLQIAHFFKPEAAVLRSTTEDFSAVNLNLGKPRQFRAPASFEVLAPPPEKNISELLDHHSQGNLTPRLGSQQQQQQQQSQAQQQAAAAAARRNVQVPDRAPIVAPYMPGENPGSLSPQLNAILRSNNSMMMPGGRPGSPTRGGGSSAPTSPTTVRRPDPPTGPTDFHGIQQNALFDMYMRREAEAADGGHTFDGVGAPMLGGQRDLKSDKASESLQRRVEERDRKARKLREQQERDSAAVRSASSPSGAAGLGGASPSGSPTTGAMRRQQLAQQLQQQQQQAQQPYDPTASSSPMFYQQQLAGQHQYQLAAAAAQQQPQFSQPTWYGNSNNNVSTGGEAGFMRMPVAAVARNIPFGRSAFDPAFGSMVGDGNDGMHQGQHQQQQQQQQGQYDIINDRPFFAELPERFAGRTVEEVRGAVDVVERLEHVNDELRKEVLELQLRERALRAAPIPLGRVVPLDAAVVGAAVRNLGVLVCAICRRQRLLNAFHSMSGAQQSLLQDQSRSLSNELSTAAAPAARIDADDI